MTPLLSPSAFSCFCKFTLAEIGEDRKESFAYFSVARAIGEATTGVGTNQRKGDLLPARKGAATLQGVRQRWS